MESYKHFLEIFHVFPFLLAIRDQSLKVTPRKHCQKDTFPTVLFINSIGFSYFGKTGPWVSSLNLYYLVLRDLEVNKSELKVTRSKRIDVSRQ